VNIRSAALAAVTAAAALLTIGGCSTNCNTATAYNGVLISFTPALNTAGPATLEACVNNLCQTSTVDLTSPTSIQSSAIHNGDAVVIKITARDSSGRVLGGGTVSTTPTKFEPNGAGCSPTAWEAKVQVSPSDLTAL